MDGLKKLFSLGEVDVVTVDGKIDRVEFMAAIMKCSPAAAEAAVKQWTFMQRLRANLDDAMAKFSKFDTDSSGFIEAKELGDSTDEKTKGLTDGLPEGKVDADAWTTHCLARLPVLGWPRTYAMLMVYSARLEKIADMESAMG